MYGKFYKCKQLMKINQSNFNSINVTDKNSIIWRYSNKLKDKFDEINERIKYICHL